VTILIRLLGGTKNVLLAAGALAGAVIAIVTVVTMVLPEKTHPSTVNASFLEAKVEPDVLLEQYEYNNRPAALGTASTGSQTEAIGYRLADARLAEDTPGDARGSDARRNHAYADDARADDAHADDARAANVKPATPRPAVVVFATVLRGATSASTSTSTASEVGEPAGSGNQGTTVESTKEETIEEREAKKIEEKEEEPTVNEEVKVKEEAKRSEEAKIRETREATLKESKEAQARMREEAKEKAKEEAKVKKEEQEEEKLAHIRKSTPAHGQGGHHPEEDAVQYPAFATPPPPAASFHKEGHAKVIVGTGAPTSEVDSVLSKVKALLRKRHARFNGSNIGFGKHEATFDEEDPVLREISTGEPLHRQVAGGPEEDALANSVPSQCGAGCALRPTIDKAIADYSSNLAEAAKEIANAFTDSRVQIYEHKPQPVGVTVNYAINLIGFAGQRVILEWTLCSKPANRPLPKPWWRNVIVKQIVPTNEKIKTSGNFWAPVPPARGNYYFRLRVFDGNSEPTHKTSDPFN
jgi:hypothetical protein